MIDNNSIIILVIIILIINSFFIGYLLGRSVSTKGVSNNNTKSFFKREHEKLNTNNPISIDDKKFVADIKTDGLEKKYDSLGDIKKSEENISNSVNKLKNLKR
jgi:hypothetical protein